MAGGGEDVSPYASDEERGDVRTVGAQGLPQSGFPMATTPVRTPESEKLVSLYCQNNPNYRLSMRSDGIVLAFKNEEDTKQQWVKIDVGDKFKDQEGSHGFVLVNRSTGHALSHNAEQGETVSSKPYQPDSFEGSILWSMSRDVGEGYTAIRPVTNIHLNLDADHGDDKHGGVADGNKLILFKWNKQENQKWRIIPLESETPASV
ncbi:hypothetical protein R1sor_013671 [Riccia sorocarpa]|uniref:Ricin B lectin domain-containing protein n=1 Tax=Riccia sorocarpa TaxID=122646 RepID=A0ABD3H784_9MARC